MTAAIHSTHRSAALSLAAILAATIAPISNAEPVRGLFPAGTEAGFILRYADLPEPMRSAPKRLIVDGKGRAHLLVQRSLIALRLSPDDKPAASHLPGKFPIDDIAWMADGALIVIAGQKLRLVGATNFETLLELPSDSMRITTASPRNFYLHGGSTQLQRRSVYLYEKGGQLLHLLRFPIPVTAVAGDGRITFLAAGKGIYRFLADDGVRQIYEATTDIRALALADSGGLFFATKASIGYLTGPGRGFFFLDSRNADLATYGDRFYFALPQTGVLSGAPIKGFDALAAALTKPEAGTTP